MDFSQVEKSPAKKFGGLAFVVFLHIFIVYALVTGLARKVVEVIKQPLETKIIEEIKPPPPPDVPPPPPPPKLLAPPPPFIPPPEVQIQQPMPTNTIQATTQVQPENPVMPQPQRPAVAEAPTGPPVVTGAITDLNACKPEYPQASLRAEETGVSTVQFLIGADNQLVEAKLKKSSGSRKLDKAAIDALSHCKFKAGVRDGKPVQSWVTVEYVWKLE